MRTKTIRVFQKYIVVLGAGDFPFDMLRYDSAFPLTEMDSHLIESPGRRVVALAIRSVNDSGPTVGRWQSFSWSVVGVFNEATEAESARLNYTG